MDCSAFVVRVIKSAGKTGRDITSQLKLYDNSTLFIISLHAVAPHLIQLRHFLS